MDQTKELAALLAEAVRWVARPEHQKLGEGCPCERCKLARKCFTALTRAGVAL